METIKFENEKAKLEIIFNPYLKRYGVSLLQGATQKAMVELLQEAQEKTNAWLVNQVNNIKEVKACIKAGLFYYQSEKVNVKQVEQLLEEKQSIMLSNKPLEN